MTTVSGWDIRIDTVIRQVLRDVKRDKTLLKGSMFTKRQTFLSLLKTALVRSFPSANIVIVRHGQIHQCRADHVMRRVEGPIPVLSDFFGFGSYDYNVYVCRRGSFTNFGHGGPLDLVWAGPAEVSRQTGMRSQTLMFR